jgi:hypothetical protein
LNTCAFQTACTLKDVGPDGVGLADIRDHGIKVAVAVEVAEGD